MRGVARWRRNLLVVSPPGAVRAHLPLLAPTRRALERRVRALGPGTPVLLTASWPGAASRCRSFGSRSGVTVEREFLALPSVEAPGCLVEDAQASVGALMDSVPVVPPRGALSAVADLGARLLRALRPWRAIRALAPGRVVVGVRG